MSVAQKIREDAQAALKDGDRKRASALRMIQDVLQQEAKLGKGDEVGALQRERKKRMEAAEAFFADDLSRPHFALTLSVEEADSQFSWKTNSIHPRLRAAAKS